MKKRFRVTVNGKVYEVEVEEVRDKTTQPVVDSQTVVQPVTATPVTKPTSSRSSDKELKSPMAGRVVEIKVSPGKEVKKGEVVLILEAMKMNNDIVSPRDGVVAEVKVKEGETVEAGQTLVVFE